MAQHVSLGDWVGQRSAACHRPKVSVFDLEHDNAGSEPRFGESPGDLFGQRRKLEYEYAEAGLFVSDADLTTLTRFDFDLDDANLPAVSPDGNTVAFLFHDQVWLMGLDGSNLRQLTFFDEFVYSISWSPEGNALVMTRGQCDDMLLVTLEGDVTELSSEGQTLRAEGRVSWR